MTNRPQDQQPRRRPANARPSEQEKRDANEQSGSTGRNAGTGDPREDGENTGQERYAPQPGHEAGSSGTSEYGRSDYGEPTEPDRDETPQEHSQSQSQSQNSSEPASPPRIPSKQRQ